MKKIAIALLFGVFGFGASAFTADAQLGIMPVHIGLGAGVVIPVSDLSNSFGTGFNVMGTLAVTPPLIPLGFRGDVAYNQFGAKGASNVNAKIGSATANVVYGLPGVVITPYLIGGVGYYRLSSSLTGTTASNHFGYNAGGGLNLGLLAFRAFVEARYNRVSQGGSAVAYLPVTFGLMF